LRGYDLTERGKIIIAIILVALIFVLPAVVLALNAWSNANPPPDGPSQTVVPEEPPPEISNTPLPNGSGFNPQDPPDSSSGEQGSFDPPTDPVVDIPKFGPVSINSTAGNMIFRFAPGLQDALDAETLSMIGEFIKSPKNTSNARIAVEMPQLHEDDISKIITAVSNAFASLGIALEKLAFATYHSESEDGSYEVKLILFVDTYKK